MDRLCAVAVSLLVASLPANVLAQSADARAGVFLKERVYAELSSSQALSNIYGYVKDTRGWEPADYHVAVAKGRRVPVVYVITHLAATKDVLIRGGAAFEIHLDAESGQVVGENPLSDRDLAKAISSTD